jgi:hypothetical protein
MAPILKNKNKYTVRNQPKECEDEPCRPSQVIIIRIWLDFYEDDMLPWVRYTPSTVDNHEKDDDDYELAFLFHLSLPRGYESFTLIELFIGLCGVADWKAFPRLASVE